jgi:anti-sigma B factor antagonist
MFEPLPPEFEIAVSRTGRRAVLALSGEFDLSVEPEVTATLERVVATPESIVVLDLRALTFIDSTGIRALIEAQRRCATAHCALYLVSGPPEVRRVLTLCCIEERFALLRDPADAPTLTAVPDLPDTLALSGVTSARMN